MNQLNELFAALAKAQGKMGNAEKNSDNTYLKSKYADLASVVEAARPHLTENGLCVVQLCMEIDGAKYLKTILGHSSGQSIESIIKVEVKADPNNTKINYMHALGSSLTYLRRYTYQCITGVTVGVNDDDGNSSMPQNYFLTDEKSSDMTIRDKRASEELISTEEVQQIEEMIGDNIELLNDALLVGKIGHLKNLQKSRLAGFMTWIQKEKSKRIEKSEVEDFIL